MRNRIRIARNLIFKGFNKDHTVYMQFRTKKKKDGAHAWEWSEWYEIANAFVVNHNFRAWRPEENHLNALGDIKEGYSQLVVSKIDLDQFERDNGKHITKDTKIRFQSITYSILGPEQFQQRDMIVYDLMRMPQGG